MDWSKAKTIIIIAFIITNILLLYMIVGQKPIKDPTLTDAFIDKSKKLLDESDIGLDVDIPRVVPKLNTITVNYEDLSLDSVNKKFLDKRASVKLEDGRTILEYDREKIILENRSLKYFNQGEEGLYRNLDKDKVLKISRDFLLKRGYSIEDLDRGRVFEEDGVYSLLYSKKYKDVFVEDSYTLFKIDSRGVREFERLWLNVQDEGDKEVFIGTAPKAVLALLGREDFAGRRIVDISLCYYFDSKMEDFLKEPVDSIEGRAVPAWRIELDNGDKFIVDEY